MLTGEHANSLWTFSLDFYALDGVSARLIEWQDRDGLDINVVLCLCWYAGRGVFLDENAVSAMVAAVEPWRVHVIAPVRAARRALKTEASLRTMPDVESLRKQLLKLELQLERSVQERLQLFSDALGQSGATDAESVFKGRFVEMLARYAKACGVVLPEFERLAFAACLQGYVVDGEYAIRTEEKSSK